MLITEDWLNKWQRMAQACVHAGKPIGGPWSIRVTGHCPATGRKVGIIARGEDNTIASAMEALLRAPEWEPLVNDERLKKIMEGVR